MTTTARPPDGDPEGEKRTAFSYWFPKLRIDPIYLPKTFILDPIDFDLSPLIDGEHPSRIDELIDAIDAAVQSLGGYPAFLRTDRMSGKHGGWTKPAPFLDGRADIIQSLHDITEETFLANLFMGDGLDRWIVRERLPTETAFFAFARLPIVNERRFIVRGGKVVQSFPYWPIRAISDRPHADLQRWIGQIADGSECQPLLAPLSEQAVADLPGDWSVDWMQTANGWKLIDMAAAELSWTPSNQDYLDWLNCLKIAEQGASDANADA